ncbi:unnamed protein product [Eruca vesicaria subsp. sativa]|uniref:Uncharacterized protein n=1 Tax=Eruca vesicaria subsp. sativa TaxID=29727 RepID=A0ABC8JKP3_ERUVS|nr:unnamed protein product [Eruca vesicaria subsp. sativa]
MKREGRQHGFVRTWMILQAKFNSRLANQYVNQLHSPPAFGVFTKVSSKPTNHSKFTGKCEKIKFSNCHMSPATKSADKSKGRHRLKATIWLAEDKLDGFVRLDSFSARSIVHQLCGEDHEGHVYDHVKEN